MAITITIQVHIVQPAASGKSITQIRSRSICKALAGKIFVFRFSENHVDDPPCPASMKRGERVVTIVRRDAMDVMAPRDERRSWHAAKARGPDAPTLVSSARATSRGDGGQKARCTEESAQ
jgi:hypothetical protein